MPRKANFIFDVRIRIAEAFTLDTIVRSPRTFKPKDVLAACHNNELELKYGSPPPAVVRFATYIMTDFFAVMHATGLYNRQITFWESLSQINSVHVYQLTKGLMNKQNLPLFELSFLDYKGKPLVYAFLVAGKCEKSSEVGLFKGFLSRAHGKSSLTGALGCFPKAAPKEALELLNKLTYSEDPILRYESILPGTKMSVDLLEMDDKAPDDQGAEFTLLHPDLRKGKNGVSEPMRVMKKVMPQPKEENCVSENSAP